MSTPISSGMVLEHRNLALFPQLHIFKGLASTSMLSITAFV